jgi:prepilin-type N-terminal cleavage/methylation domain-containing protein
MKRKKGFTLIELLVVISVIAVLMAILVPVLGRAREFAKRTICASNLKQIGIAVSAYSADTDFLPFYGGWDFSWRSPFNVPNDKKSPQDELHPYAVYRADKDPWWGPTSAGPPYPMKLACLYARGYIGDGKVFYCPSNRDPAYTYRSYTKPLSPNTSNEWGTLPQAINEGGNQWVRVGYSYYPIDETLKAPPVGMVMVHGIYVPRYTARRFSLLHRRNPYVTDGLWEITNLSHKTGIKSLADGTERAANPGINALFKDGHVRFVKDEKVVYQGNQVSVFDNFSWDVPIGGSEKPTDVDCRFRFYPVYSMINP